MVMRYTLCLLAKGLPRVCGHHCVVSVRHLSRPLPDTSSCSCPTAIARIMHTDLQVYGALDAYLSFLRDRHCWPTLCQSIADYTPGYSVSCQLCRFPVSTTRCIDAHPSKTNKQYYDVQQATAVQSLSLFPVSHGLTPSGEPRA